MDMKPYEEVKSLLWELRGNAINSGRTKRELLEIMNHLHVLQGEVMLQLEMIPTSETPLQFQAADRLPHPQMLQSD